MTIITVSVGNSDLDFNPDHEDFNRFLNEQTPGDKIGPAYNFLSRTVADSSREAFNAVCLTAEKKPKGVIILQIVGIVSAEIGGDVSITLKKPKT